MLPLGGDALTQPATGRYQAHSPVWYLPNLFNWIQNTKRNKNYYINSQPYLLRYTPTASVGEDYGDAIYLLVTDL